MVSKEDLKTLAESLIETFKQAGNQSIELYKKRFKD